VRLLFVNFSDVYVLIHYGNTKSILVFSGHRSQSQRYSSSQTRWGPVWSTSLNFREDGQRVVHGITSAKSQLHDISNIADLSSSWRQLGGESASKELISSLWICIWSSLEYNAHTKWDRSK
jgi:hypothetical protein